MSPAADIRDLLRSQFGYDSFLPLQEEIIRNALAGGHALALLPTGGGKSLCYQLPALCLDGLTLVVSPLIALMKDQVDALRANGVPAAFVNSSLTYAQARRALSDAESGRVKLLYAAPERLAIPGFQRVIAAARLSLIAIDEAHCISEWGHDFRPDYRNLKTLRERFPNVPCIALTATATPRVRADIIDHLNIQDGGMFVSSFNRENLTYAVRPKSQRFDALLDLLRRHEGESSIIYCFSRNDTEELAASLRQRGIDALPYHAGMAPDERRKNQESFINGGTPIIVATIAFGMGIDKPDVRLIVHYDMPKSVEGYFQETGRAGRDGEPSECALFYSPADRSKQQYLINQQEDGAAKSRAWKNLDHIVDYCEGQRCRRAFLLRYFGEQWEEENCAACDVCLSADETEEFDATEIAQKILSAVIKTGQRFGAAHVVQVLLGSKSKRVTDAAHDSLSVHGIARDHSRDELRDFVRALVDRGLLAREEGQYPTLSVTASGRRFLDNRESLTLDRARRTQSPKTTAPGAAPDHDSRLFEALRRTRLEIARSQGLPAYSVFNDESLKQMAQYRPQDMEAFRRVKGVGDAKLQRYAQMFLHVIREHTGEDGAREGDQAPTPTPAKSAESERPPSRTHFETLSLFRRGMSIEAIAEERQLNAHTIFTHLERLAAAGEDIDVSRISPPSPPHVIRQPTQNHLETLALFRRGLTIEGIAAERGISADTILSHLEFLAAAGEDIDVTHLLDPERCERIRQEFERADTRFLSPIREALGEDYTYEEIRLARLQLQRSPSNDSESR